MRIPDSFTHSSLPMRVVFGAGTSSEIAREVELLGLERVLVVCTPAQVGLATTLSEPLEARLQMVYPFAAMHVPATDADTAVHYVIRHAVDGCVAVGGGSSIGLAKAIALKAGIPIVAVPTTYAGSEMTTVWGLTDKAGKTTGRDPRVLPRTVIYDPELTYSLPVRASVTSGLNALAHAAEALYAPDVSPVVELVAREAASVLFSALPTLTKDPFDPRARADALYGAWLAGVCLGSTTMSLHHKLCHVLGGTFGLPHADVHAVVLPHVLATNLDASPRAKRILAEAVGSSDPARAIQDLAFTAGVLTPLSALGMPREGIDRVVDLAIARPYANPVLLSADQLRDIVSRAYAGAEPRTTLTRLWRRRSTESTTRR